MKTTKLVWRLSTKPTVEEVTKLFEQGILTKDEAKEILFSSQTEEDRDKNSLEVEIKFLKELVEKLSNQSGYRIVEIVKEIEAPYRKWPWHDSDVYWCSTIGSGSQNITTSQTQIR